MKWNPQDVGVYQKSKEYVDTAVVPLLPVTFDGEMGQAAQMSEFISLLSLQLERQFKGRILLLPGISYLKDTDDRTLVNQLLSWESRLYDSGFSHVFHLTSDLFWKSVESDLSGSLLWIPSIPLETMEEMQRNSVLESQVKQMIMLFTQKWHKKE